MPTEANVIGIYHRITIYFAAYSQFGPESMPDRYVYSYLRNIDRQMPLSKHIIFLAVVNLFLTMTTIPARYT